MTGIDNNIEVRLIYLDTKEEIWFRSIAKAIRFLGTDFNVVSSGTHHHRYLPHWYIYMIDT